MDHEDYIQLATALIIAGVPAFVTIITYTKNRNKLDNGIKSVIAEIHQDMQLTVMPTLADLREWRDGYRGTIWSDKEAIEAWLDQLAAQFGTVDEAIAAVKRDLHAHVEWEEQDKYRELEKHLEEIENERKH